MVSKHPSTNHIKGGIPLTIKRNNRLLGLLLTLFLVLSTFALTGCGDEKADSQPENGTSTDKATTDEGQKVTVRYALADPQDLKYWDEKAADFTAKYPNSTLDIESFGGTDELMKNLKIRQAANELPDVIQLKPDFINDFKDSLIEWGKDEAVVSKNKFANDFAQDGKIYGLPLRCFSELVYYKKSIFAELKLEIPDTWDKFIETAKTIKADGKYIPIALGGKDAWPVYPFNEFMPHLISKDLKILSNIAKQDEPFSKGGGFYDSYEMIDNLFKAEVMGPDPLGMGNDQAQQLFEANKAAMICLGQWYLPNYIERVQNTDDLGLFPLPIVKNSSEPNRVITMADNFLTISKSSKIEKQAKEFVEWSFDKDVYEGYLKSTLNNSTVEGVFNEVPILKEYNDKFKFEDFLYFPGDKNYNSLVNETKFDVKAIGQRMLAGEKFDAILADMNKKWKAAREKLGIK